MSFDICNPPKAVEVTDVQRQQVRDSDDLLAHRLLSALERVEWEAEKLRHEQRTALKMDENAEALRRRSQFQVI